jgi:hypothetical protein
MNLIKTDGILNRLYLIVYLLFTMFLLLGSDKLSDLNNRLLFMTLLKSFTTLQLIYLIYLYIKKRQAVKLIESNNSILNHNN